MQLVWLKRDLRLDDLQSLGLALKAARAKTAGPVGLLYIHDPKVLAEPDSALQHFVFVQECLENLKAQLGQAGLSDCLSVFYADSVEVFEQLHQAHTVSHIWSLRDSTQLSCFMRDVRVRNWASRQQIEFIELRQNNVTPFGERALYRSFKPYLDAICFERLWDFSSWAANQRSKDAHSFESLFFKVAQSPVCQTLGYRAGAEKEVFGNQTLPNQSCEAKITQVGSFRRASRLKGGRTAALALLDEFLQVPVLLRYPSSISAPATALEYCSRLSVYLAYGVLSDKEVFQRVHHFYESLSEGLSAEDRRRCQEAVEFFAQRLYWRYSYLQLFEDHHEMQYKVQMPGFENQREFEHSEKLFEAFTCGKTGIPYIDAAILMLQDCGWVNMRLRGTLASFALNDLWLDWQKVGNFLARQFLDYEPAIHWNQIAIQSGSCFYCEPLQYKVIKQAQEHDPQGDFVRHWLPALAKVPTEYIFEPWMMPAHIQHESGCQIGIDYPAPVVNPHAAFEASKTRIATHRAGHVFVPGAFWKQRAQDLGMEKQQALF